MKETIEKALNRIAVSMEARKREQQLAGVFLKPISKRAKKLLEKIVANKEAYPVYVTVGDDKEDTITICEYSFMVGSKQQERSTSHCLFLLEHINRLKNHKGGK